jgi:hypothetical protein
VCLAGDDPGSLHTESIAMKGLQHPPLLSQVLDFNKVKNVAALWSRLDTSFGPDVTVTSSQLLWYVLGGCLLTITPVDIRLFETLMATAMPRRARLKSRRVEGL